MKRIAVVLLVLSVLAIPASADQFGSVVKRIESQYGVRRTHPLLIGLALLFAKPATWGSGVGGIKVAVFESENRSFIPSIANLDRIVQESVGREWRPFIRVDSRRRGEASVIYTDFRGRHMRMLIATIERSDISVVQMKIDGKAFSRWMADPEGEAERTAHNH